jgi:ParB/RepB/Spo0J family partition protein
MNTPPSSQPRGTNIKDLLSREVAAAVGGDRKLGEGRHIALDLIDPNPFQHRTTMDEDKLEELVANIAVNGQLEAVPVRPNPADPTRYQLIAGHRRTEAFRRLRDRATTDSERLQWAQLLATIKTAVTDRQMRIWGVVENVEREDTSPVEQGAALADLQEKEGLTVEELIQETGMEANRVKRLLRIAKAPEVIRDGCTKGLMVQLYDENGAPLTTPKGRAKQEHRHLDLIGALEFAALHSHFLKDGNSPKKASERLEKLIDQALTDGWSFRRIQERCKELKAPRAPKPTTDTAGGTDGAGEGTSPATSHDAPERALFKTDERQLIIYKSRLSESAPSQRAALRAALESLITEFLG